MNHPCTIGQLVELNSIGATHTKLTEGTQLTITHVAKSNFDEFIYGVITVDRKSFTIYEDEIL